jgi:predicted RNA-binding protein with PUA-like domain
MAKWLMKSEPDSYGWDDLVRDGTAEWDGVRNPAARLHLKAMQPGDQALFYHSGKEKAAVGVMTITRAWQPDGDDGEWASVAVAPTSSLSHPVTLAAMKAEPALAGMAMLRQSRLSVSPVTDAEWAVILRLAHTD